MSELTRLNYFNGMRLDAPDLRVEQNYHIDVRRRLTRALFSPGIAQGLEVVPSPNKPHHVIVRAGLAIDDQGRVMSVDEDREVLVQGIPSSEPGWVFGNYLTIRYHESKEAETADGCAVQSGCCDAAWGGPTRIVAEPLLSFQNAWPEAATGAVVLAQVELDDNCAVKGIKKGVRKYVTPVTAGARSFALEGEREIDAQNPKKIFFHLRGPTRAVILYLRALPFSSLFYTELGEHDHGVSFQTQVESPAHTHEFTLDEVATSEHEAQGHTVTANVYDLDNHALDLDASVDDVRDLAAQVNLVVNEHPAHSHTLDLGTLTTSAGGHTHGVVGSTGNAGQTQPSRTGASYSYVDDLRVLVDGQDVTAGIVNHVGWSKLGNGTSSHDLATTGTAMGIPLDQLGLDPTDGEHVIELRVSSGGGTIQYNLYVE